ncbi:MAG: ferredoxin [Actinomycetota bacterium]|nr:ferredoxin [Actinomycetota bacterium]MDQ1501285.1 ferredoxin [Actinomycetota bacterium]MDQ1503948.1 ferredoxin [Actinomycetota bacterium]MDQ1569014.1 ferredoxin [Actinomycetota bacterium]
MKVIVDPEGCTGHGRCSSVAPDVYLLDSNGYNLVTGVPIDVPEGREEAARLGARMCPERAVTITEDAVASGHTPEPPGSR